MNIPDEHILTNEHAEHLYHKFVVKDKNYFKRFSLLQEAFSEQEFAAYTNFDPPRVVSLIDFKEWIIKHGIATGENLLSTCTSDPELKYLIYKNQTMVSFPPYDLHKLNIEKKNFDFVVFNQTIEHLHSPWIALRRLYEHLRIGGYLYTTAPTINIPHLTPIHFNGYTPTGLCALMVTSGFEVCECGYWGNKKYMDFIFRTGNWPNYTDVLDDKGLLTYDPICQAQTWVCSKVSKACLLAFLLISTLISLFETR